MRRVKRLGGLAMVMAAGVFSACAATTTGNMNCDGQPVSPGTFTPQSGDRSSAQSFEVERSFSGRGKLELSVCDGTVRVRPSTDGKLGLSVEFGSKAGDGHGVADYIQKLDIQPENAVLQLKFPSSVHAVVTLTVPLAGAKSEFNLGKGDFDFDAAHTTGDREINVGMGHAKLLMGGDSDYSTMEVNVGMGSLHDHRPGGHDSHFIVSRSYSGTGSGLVELNVGAGTVDINQE